MKKNRFPYLLGISAVVLIHLGAVCCKAEKAANPETNPLIAEWTGPYGGVPAFDKMDLQYLKPALEEGMKRKWEEIEGIANNPEPATFENTIEALQNVGRDLSRVNLFFGIWSGNMSNPDFREIAKEMAPRRSELKTRIIQNEALFARIQAVYNSTEKSSLRSDQKRLLQLEYDKFVRQGARLNDEAKRRYGAINKRLAALHNDFSNNVLADEEGYVTFLEQSQLSGLPDSYIYAAASAAKKRGKPGSWAVTNTGSSIVPFLTFSDGRDLREQVWHNYYSRGNNGGEHDNNAIIAELLQLRYERSKLLGYDNYAEWKLELTMAKSPENVMELLNRIWPMAKRAVEDEVAKMQSVADAEGAGINIEPWDYRYYANKVQKADYALDSKEVKSYLQLDKLREAMFYVAGRLFDFKFGLEPENTVPVFHEEVTVWEVTRKSTGEHVGLWYFDPFARVGKRSGAWARFYRHHETFKGKRTVLCSNNSNFVKPAPGAPLMISWGDANTLFHEFGHSLHFLSSTAAYPGLNRVIQDYLEFPSQLLENWLSTDVVLENYLLHYETGQPIPAELAAKIKRAANFNQGFRTTRYMASAIMDMKYHTTDPRDLDPQAFELKTLQELGMPSEVGMVHRSTHIKHVFGYERYASGFYSYIWARVLTADAAEAFKESPQGFYDEALCRKMLVHLFAPMNSVDPADAYRAFRGRDPHFEALVRARGFPLPNK